MVSEAEGNDVLASTFRILARGSSHRRGEALNQSNGRQTDMACGVETKASTSMEKDTSGWREFQTGFERFPPSMGKPGKGLIRHASKRILEQKGGGRACWGRIDANGSRSPSTWGEKSRRGRGGSSQNRSTSPICV